MAPVDDATLSVNPGNFLEKHLRSVVGWLVPSKVPVEPSIEPLIRPTLGAGLHLDLNICVGSRHES